MPPIQVQDLGEVADLGNLGEPEPKVIVLRGGHGLIVVSRLFEHLPAHHDGSRTKAVRFKQPYLEVVVHLGKPRLGAFDPSLTTRVEQQFLTLRQALRTPAFWFISLGHASALLVVSAVTVHLILHLTENLGYSIRTAGLVVALMTASQVVGMLAGGYLGDRISKRVIVVTAMASHATGLLLLAYASHFWMVGLFALLHGGAWGARGPLMQAIRADYFGRRSFGTIMGFSSLIVMVGTTVGPIVAGVLADRTGSYESGFTILAIAAAAGSIFFILARQPTPPGEAERVQAAHDAPDLSPAPAPAPAEG